MIWSLLILSLGLASARGAEIVDPEFLDELRESGQDEQFAESVDPEFLDELRESGQDEQFAELLGIEKNLVRPDDSEQRTEGSRLNHVSMLGDVLLTEDQERSIINFNRYGGSRWPNARIPYSIASDFNAQERQFITNSINAFNARSSKLKVVPRNGESDYVYVFSGNGCYSYLGRTRGQQALSLQKNGCLSTGTVQHEFLHAAGMAHEHNRSDRDNFVTVLWGNITERWRSQYQKVDDQTYNRIGNYDYYSVMHYPIWAPETFRDAFKIPSWVDRNRLGRSNSATNEDIRKITIAYS